MALPQQVRGAYILIERLIDSADFGGVGLILFKDCQGIGQGWAIQHSAKLKCSAASRTVHSG